MTRFIGSSGLTCGVPISALGCALGPRACPPSLFGYIQRDCTAEIPTSLCRQSGLAGG